MHFHYVIGGVKLFNLFFYEAVKRINFVFENLALFSGIGFWDFLGDLLKYLEYLVFLHEERKIVVALYDILRKILQYLRLIFIIFYFSQFYLSKVFHRLNFLYCHVNQRIAIWL